MQQVIDMIFYMLNKFWEFIFGAYVVEGVSLGMLFICMLIFSMLIRYVVAIPKAMLRRNYVRYKPMYKDFDKQLNDDRSSGQWNGS